MNLRKWMYLNDRRLFKWSTIAIIMAIWLCGGILIFSSLSRSNLRAAEDAVREYRFAKRKATVIHKGCSGCSKLWCQYRDLALGIQDRVEDLGKHNHGRRITPRAGDSAEKRRIDFETAIRKWKAELKAKDDEERRKRLDALRRDLVDLGVFEK